MPKENDIKILGNDVYNDIKIIGKIHSNSFKSILINRQNWYLNLGWFIPYELYIELKKLPVGIRSIILPVYREGVLLTRLDRFTQHGKLKFIDGRRCLFLADEYWEFRIKGKNRQQLSLFDKQTTKRREK